MTNATTARDKNTRPNVVAEAADVNLEVGRAAALLKTGRCRASGAGSARRYELGANAYVVKPMTIQDFVEAVKQVSGFWAVLNEVPESLDRKEGVVS